MYILKPIHSYLVEVFCLVLAFTTKEKSKMCYKQL